MDSEEPLGFAPSKAATTGDPTKDMDMIAATEDRPPAEPAPQPTSSSQPTDAPKPDDEEPEYIESDDEDAYRLKVNPERPRKVTEKKRRDNAIFQDWMVKNQREATKASIAAAAAGGSAVKGPRLESRSVNWLISESESKKIISSPREYQTELFERAKEKNTIVVLDTGSGKTLIAALLLDHILKQELEDRAVGKPKKVAFFLVDKVALCFQQYAVLECNLEYPVAKFYGEMTGIMRTKEFWDTQFGENMVVVCTAQILLDCLNSGFIKMSGINLLIFDEAHHTKKNHPYARIIKGHYIRETKEKPRVLGMTASPVDARTTDVRAAAMELESMLCSEIATVSDEVLVSNQRSQTEVIEYYHVLQHPHRTRTFLWQQISDQVMHNAQFRAPLEFTKEASSSLGPWCADRFWQLLITESEIARLAARTDRDFAKDFGSAKGEQANEAVRTVQKIVERHQFEDVSMEKWTLLSSKTRTLHRVLEESFLERGMTRCIVFVEKRWTASILADLFQQTGMRIRGVEASYMVGCQTTTASLGNMSFRDQVLTLQRFKRGEINCLFATNVAEEGIDVPECDLIIRFDLYNSVIQYVQSKGRARQHNSRYVCMAEEGNMMHTRTICQAALDAGHLRRFCSALPEDRKVQDQNIDAIAAAQYEQLGQKTYEVASTGARLTFPHSLEVLNKFVSSLVLPGETGPKPDFIVTGFGKKFIADVILPDSSPIKTVSGFPQRNKMLAKCSAAFEACVELIKKNYINEHFQPTFAKKLPAMRNARLAVSANKKQDYDMRIRPEVWSRLGDGKPTMLYVTALVFDNPDAVGRPTRPLLLLSRERIPDLPDISLFFGNGQSSLTKLISTESPLQLTEDEVDGLAAFTLKIFLDVFSKEYEAKPEDIPYFLAPCAQSHGEILSTSSQITVDWPTVTLVQENESLSWENAPDDFFNDKFVTDYCDGSRKLIIKGINKSLRPSDPTPAGVPEPKCRSYRFVEQTIKEYSNSLWLKARKRAKWKDDQPVMNAELLSLRRNYLDEFQVDEDIDNECFVILEPLQVSPLPIDVVGMVMAFPAILHRIDSALIALDACTLLDLDIDPTLALEAVTKDSDNSGDHGEEQINFQPGMGNNYERLEFLGDSFLKMATTISLFTLIPDSNEFEYHVERMLLICNQNLFNHAVDRNLQEYVRSKAFDRRAWYPNLPLKKGKAPKTELRHNLADKSIADVCEALIGAAYLTTEPGNFDMAVKAVTRMVKHSNHAMLSFADYYAAFKIPSWQSGPSSAAQRYTITQVAAVTGYEFKSAPLLRSAFKHPSYPYDPIPNYQRLEFLGDALLDMAIVDYLFRNFPSADPQWLTEHKMAMASNHFLGCVCVSLSLQKHLLVTTSALLGQIHEYVTELDHARETAEAEAAVTGQPLQQNFWITTAPPPKALPDIVEALIGAMFVDASYDYSVVEAFFARFIQPYFADMALYDTFANKHPVTFLQHKMQQELFCTQWRIMTSEVPRPIEEGIKALTESDVICALMVHGEVFVHHTAKSGRYAKIAVAKKALEKFEELGVEEVKRKMGCDCKASVEGALDIAKGMEMHGTAV